MSSLQLRTLYHQSRKAGEPAIQAWRTARILRQWEALESVGAVRLEAVPDDSPTDALDYLEQDCFQDRQGRAIAKRVRQTAENDGVWGLVGQFRDDFDNTDSDGCWNWDESRPRDWETGGSVWGFIGDDVRPERNPYAVDIMAETITAFATAWKSYVTRRRDLRAGRCPECHGSGQAA